jgi:lysophospholipase L1-like esterase
MTISSAALRRSILPLCALLGQLACSSTGSDASDGTPATGGSGSPVAGSSSIAGASSASAGNNSAGGNTSGSLGGNGGLASSAGAPTAGGAQSGNSAGAANNGGAAGGAVAGGGASATGGATATGGSGGATATAGSGGAAGTTATGGNAPPGYPAPTTDNYSKCKTVPMTGTVCPGGGPGPVCIECLFGGDTYTVPNVATADGKAEAGNYVVTVQVGGAAAGQTFISAESNRGLLSSVSTAAGQSAEYSFVVNVRQNEGQPVEANASAGYPGLDLFFSGTTAMPPQVSAVGYALTSATTKPVMLYIASDSTVCDQTASAFAGWGQMLPEFFAPPLGVANYADSGESSASFYGNGQMWGAIKAHWAPGDWVIIQFGHNDKTSSDAQVETNLEKYVTDALAANVTPILVSPPARVGDWDGAVLASQAGLHPASAMGAAAAKKVAFIDLTSMSIAWYNTLGSKAAALQFHANDSDATHTNLAGATKLASLVAGAIKTQNIGLTKYLR